MCETSVGGLTRLKFLSFQMKGGIMGNGYLVSQKIKTMMRTTPIINRQSVTGDFQPSVGPSLYSNYGSVIVPLVIPRACSTYVIPAASMPVPARVRMPPSQSNVLTNVASRCLRGSPGW